MTTVSERCNFEIITNPPPKQTIEERKVEELERPIPVILPNANNQTEVNPSSNDGVEELQKWADVTIRNDEDLDTN